MAISKKITLANGVAVNYHRVVSVNTVTNVSNIIELASYTSKAKRTEEKAALEAGRAAAAAEGGDAPNAGAVEHDVFIQTSYYNAGYDQGMTIVDAYEWVKALPEFEGATDVLEGEEVPAAE